MDQYEDDTSQYTDHFEDDRLEMSERSSSYPKFVDLRYYNQYEYPRVIELFVGGSNDTIDLTGIITSSKLWELKDVADEVSEAVNGDILVYDGICNWNKYTTPQVPRLDLLAGYSELGYLQKMALANGEIAIGDGVGIVPWNFGAWRDTVNSRLDDHDQKLNDLRHDVDELRADVNLLRGRLDNFIEEVRAFINSQTLRVEGYASNGTLVGSAGKTTNTGSNTVQMRVI